MKADGIAHVWREIMSACRALEARQRVAYLGPAGTFSEQAALQFFGSSIDHVPCASFDEVFHATASGRADFGVVPVENNTEGVVTRSLDLLLHSPLHIVGEVSLLVRHNLLRLQNSLDGIEVVLAHPQALAQCQGWLATHLPNAERRAASSNAEGARLAATQSGLGRHRQRTRRGASSACIWWPRDPGRRLNRTRFGVICLPQIMDAPQPSGNDCISLVVSVPNRPGAVHDLLVPLKQHGVSMTRFESRPDALRPMGVLFLHRPSGPSQSQPNVAAALTDLQGLCEFYKVLGTYPAADQ